MSDEDPRHRSHAHLIASSVLELSSSFQEKKIESGGGQC